MRVTVTGGAGNVGRYVVERLLAEGHAVTVYDRQAPTAEVAHVIGDVLDPAALAEAFDGTEAVVHLAAVPALGRAPDDELMEINVMGTERVAAAAAARGVRRLVAASSDSTLGFVFGEGRITPDYLPCDESHPLRPLDAYGLSKVINEEICRRYTRAVGLETVCLRYCWVWGPGEYAAVESFQAQPHAFVGQLWGYVDGRDVAQAVARALVAADVKHETLFISAGRTFMREPTLKLVREHLPARVEVRNRDRFAEEPNLCLLDCSRAEEVLGYRPEFDWEACAGA
ncbi:MAG: NAD(P)-dependent oxidoreductase [Armatimonadetes bacterium]|nr:NAD(P)-dependent oxidoreductase [Armatimonadota bacterium]